MTQWTAAGRLGVSRATVAQWETGRHLPAELRVHQLDRLLDAKGDLIAAAEQARSRGHRLRPIDTADPSHGVGTKSLLHLLTDIRHAFLDQLCYDGDGRPIGWRNDLVESNARPSVLSTAYGLKVLAMLGGPDARTQAVVEQVLRSAVRSDDALCGWQACTQNAPRLETTAINIDSLLRIGVPLSPDVVSRMLQDLVDDTARERPFILACALEPLLRVAPDSDLATELVRALLTCRVEFGGVLLWPEKRLRRDQPLLNPSVAHTARAVTVLRNGPEALLGDAVSAAEQWIAEAESFDDSSEIIRRDLKDQRREELAIHHFTSTWVVRALAGATALDRTRIDDALAHVWTRYDPALRFWAWGNGDVPVWMLADALAALHDAALALHPTPAAVIVNSS